MFVKTKVPEPVEGPTDNMIYASTTRAIILDDRLLKLLSSFDSNLLFVVLFEMLQQFFETASNKQVQQEDVSL
jgi:hypothetical protein